MLPEKVSESALEKVCTEKVSVSKMCGTRKSIGTVENFGYRHTLAPRTGRPSPKVLAAIKDSDRIHNANLAKLENVALHPDLNESFTKL